MIIRQASLILKNMDEDRVVIGKIMGGDVDAFEVLLRKYSPRVFSMVGHKVPVSDVEAVAQDVFLSAFRSLGSYEAVQPFENWLSRIIRRRCCDYWRNRERSDRVESASMDDPDCPWMERTLAGLSHSVLHQENARQDAMERVRRGLWELDPEDRVLIESVYFEQVPLKEVAATFAWSMVKTKVRAHRARKKLRLIMESIFQSGGMNENHE